MVGIMTALILWSDCYQGYYMNTFLLLLVNCMEKSIMVFFSNIKRKTDNDANRRGHSIYIVKNKQSKFYVFSLNQGLLYLVFYLLYSWRTFLTFLTRQMRFPLNF